MSDVAGPINTQSAQVQAKEVKQLLRQLPTSAIAAAIGFSPNVILQDGSIFHQGAYFNDAQHAALLPGLQTIK